MGNKDDGYLPLFETEAARGRVAFRCLAASILVAICFIFFYRLSHFPLKHGTALETWAWLGLSLSELWFSFYWFITAVVRWNPLFRRTFKDRLTSRCNDLPRVDIFVCTADPVLEPPVMVVNTVLSVMAYDYPPEKLAVYLSDDGGSAVMFYAMLEAARFAGKWLPFCRMMKVEPRSPEAYFAAAHQLPPPAELEHQHGWLSVKKYYEEMRMRIERASRTGQVPVEMHQGFRHWDFVSSRRDHPTILQILIDGREVDAVDTEGRRLPTLVYLSREKRPHLPHNFKAGAMNALIRVSSRISNGPIILNLDCDMYSNNSASIRDALCFFMDEQMGAEIGFVQYPQQFGNITKNDLYSSSLAVIMDVEMHGFDGNGGPPYIGTGCFHRREVLSGNKYVKGSKTDWEKLNAQKIEESSKTVLEDECKVLASCSYEDDTQWGKEMGLKYGCPVEDIITGLSIQCKGWRSVYFNPERKGFLGLATTTLLDTLVQRKRWSEGDFQIFLSKHCPFVFGKGKIPLKLQLSYCVYLLWAVNCFASLCYAIVPPLCLLKGISLFPKVSSPWVLPFVYSLLANHVYSLGEFLWCGGTFLGWCNDQRVWLFIRITSHLFAFIDTTLKFLKCSQSTFVITTKVADDKVSRRYEQEVMEFGVSSPMFDILALVAMLNLFGCFWAMKMAITGYNPMITCDLPVVQVILCSFTVLMNWPIYKGLFFRRDNGALPTSVMCKSITLALLACAIAMY